MIFKIINVVLLLSIFNKLIEIKHLLENQERSKYERRKK